MNFEGKMTNKSRNLLRDAHSEKNKQGGTLLHLGVVSALHPTETNLDSFLNYTLLGFFPSVSGALLILNMLI